MYLSQYSLLSEAVTKRPDTSQLHAIPSGVAGTLATLKIMWLLVKKSKIELPIRQLALKLTKDIKQKDFAGEVRALHNFVRDEIRYVKDIDGVETVHDAIQVLKQRAGDCDDKSILLASMLASIGHRVRLVAVALQPHQYCHVFVETLIGRVWVPLETTEPVEVGWEYPHKFAQRMIYPPMGK